MMEPTVFHTRRNRLLDTIAADGIVIVPANRELIRNGDVYFPFRQHSDFYYLTGFAEPSAMLVLAPQRAEGDYILFNRPTDPEHEVWVGRFAGQQGAKETYGADQSFPIVEFADRLPNLLQDRNFLYYPVGFDQALDETVTDALNTLRKNTRQGGHTPHEIIDLNTLLHEMRVFKRPEEITALRNAGEIAAKAHCRAMQYCQPGMNEVELEAEILHEFHRQGCRSPAYPSIVAGGINACTLHYTQNDQPLQDGDLVLIDAGVEYDYYASDITRTFPVNGRFTDPQRTIYELVLKAQQRIIESIHPGLPWSDLQKISVETLTEGLIDLGILTDPNDAKRFYLHSVSHFLGLDVHDVGQYKLDDAWRAIEPGMVFTVEPGLYIPDTYTDVDSQWHNIGIRIEDDILVTAQGAEVLTASVPKSVADIEALCQTTP